MGTNSEEAVNGVGIEMETQESTEKVEEAVGDRAEDRKSLLLDDQIKYGSLKRNGDAKNGVMISIEDNCTYVWKNIDVYGKKPTEGCMTKLRNCCRRNREAPVQKQILKNVSGMAKSGEMLSILGSSGAGKSTLLNALAYRSTNVEVSGIRAINGVPIDSVTLRSQCAYVQQDDLFIGSLTVLEHLIFQAMLRLGRRVSYQEKLMRVNEVINELSLKKCENTQIGIPGLLAGLSGGERKRLAFASEILTDPNLLLCDEPTSGLDSFMAHSVLQVLKRLCEKGKTVIVTIHQPSSELYELFDKVMLMAEGRVAFLGDLELAASFFTEIGHNCPTNYNPADFYVRLLSVLPSEETECREKIHAICDAYEKSDVAEDNQKESRILGSSDRIAFRKSSYQKPNYNATWWTQFTAVLWRSWLIVKKDPKLIRTRLSQTIIVALFIGLIFFKQTVDQDGIMNINGAIFLFVTSMTFQNVFTVIHAFCSELPIFLRETKGRLYKMSSYFMGKTLAELPLFIVIPFLFTVFSYPMIGLREGWYHFGIAFLIMFLVTNVSTSFGYFISCMCSSVSLALGIAPPITIPFMIFGGFFLNVGSVSAWFSWLSYLSWFRYGNEAMMINQWADFPRDQILCTRNNTACATSGEMILDTYNFAQEDFLWCIGALIALIVFFRAISICLLKLRTRDKE